VREVKYLEYNEAKKIVHSFCLTTPKEWRRFCYAGKCPENIPPHPIFYYGNKWGGWKDWLGK